MAETAIARRWSPRAARWVLREPRLLWSVVLLLRGRRDGTPPARGFSAHREALPAWLVLGAVAAVEVVVTLLLPLPGPVHTVLLLLGIWGLLVVVELAAAVIVHPHLLTAEQARLPLGFWDEIALRRDCIASVRRTVPRSASRGLRCADGRASLAPNGVTNVEITLVRPIQVAGQDISRVQFWADDAASFLEAARA